MKSVSYTRVYLYRHCPLRLLVIVFSLLALCDTAAYALDPSPGWVVILASDYLGINGDLYESAQRDAIRACQTAVNLWKVPLDHIVVLAESRENDLFSLFMHARRPEDVNLHTAKADRTMMEILADLQKELPYEVSYFRDNFTDLHDDRLFPFVGYPSAQNFRIARDVVSRLVGPKQFVAFIISTRAPAQTGTGLVWPNEATADTGNCLTAEDFLLKDCKARYRLLLIDASKVGGGDSRRGRLSSPADCFDLQKQLSDGGKGNAIVMAAHTGLQGSFLSGDESAFLKSFWAFMERGVREETSLTINELFEKVKARTAAYTNRKQSPALYASSARDKTLRDVFFGIPPVPQVHNTAIEIRIKPADIRHSELRDPRTNRMAGVVYIGDSLFVMLHGDKKHLSLSRAIAVADRIKRLVAARRTLKKTDIGVGKVNGDWAVVVPKSLVAEGYILTVDAEFARLRNHIPEELARQLANRLYDVLTTPQGTL